MGEGLLRTVGEFPLSIGAASGTTVKEAGRSPGALAKWAKKPAKGPAQARGTTCGAVMCVCGKYWEPEGALVPPHGARSSRQP